MHTFISSLQNQRIKQAIRLNNRRQRDLQQRTLVEGVREVSRALASGLTPYEAFYCPQIAKDLEAQRVSGIVGNLGRARADGTV